MSISTRAVAAEVLVRVLEQGESLTIALEPRLTRFSESRDRALVQTLVYGTLRWYWRLAALQQQLCRRPVEDARVRALLLLGLFQLIYTRVKTHAAVAETVAAAGRAGWARGLVNGVLRTFLRERERLEALVDADPATCHAYPVWLVERLREDWPQHWRDILDAGNQPPPMTLRVDRRRSSRAAYLEELLAAGLDARLVEGVPDAITLEHPCEVTALPGFGQGRVSVQDAAAQLAAPWLDVQPGQRVLDACAAPGGKTAHVLECCPALSELVAVDLSETRLARVRENLDRQGLAATLIAADAADTAAWWDGAPFERILLDAPCTATGVIRRHPDIKVLRRPTDVATLAAQQSRLLAALWPLLRPGGVLLYATCSLLNAENVDRMAGFLAQTPDAQESPLFPRSGVPVAHGVQILPVPGGMDGFYYCRLVKAA